MPAQSPLNRKRRALLRATLASTVSWLLSRSVFAEWPGSAFAAKTQTDALRQLFSDTWIAPSDRIAIELPGLAENGAVVPLTVTADFPAVESISVVSDKNPVPLIARFDFGPDATGGYIATRIKLAESGNVTVVVRADGKLYSAQKFIEVTVGGCD